jgi:hypothetical protein
VYFGSRNSWTAAQIPINARIGSAATDLLGRRCVWRWWRCKQWRWDWRWRRYSRYSSGNLFRHSDGNIRFGYTNSIGISHGEIVNRSFEPEVFASEGTNGLLNLLLTEPIAGYRALC